MNKCKAPSILPRWVFLHPFNGIKGNYSVSSAPTCKITHRSGATVVCGSHPHTRAERDAGSRGAAWPRRPDKEEDDGVDSLSLKRSEQMDECSLPRRPRSSSLSLAKMGDIRTCHQDCLPSPCITRRRKGDDPLAPTAGGLGGTCPTSPPTSFPLDVVSAPALERCWNARMVKGAPLSPKSPPPPPPPCDCSGRSRCGLFSAPTFSDSRDTLLLGDTSAEAISILSCDGQTDDPPTLSPASNLRPSLLSPRAPFAPFLRTGPGLALLGRPCFLPGPQALSL